MNINNTHIRVFEGFAGYGGASFALKRLQKTYPQFTFEIVGYSEIDRWASELYDLNHRDDSGNTIRNYGDITKIDPAEIPDFDLFTGGFPCQPFSLAGMMKGEDDPYNRGTLFRHIIRICESKKPRFVLLENVKGFNTRKFDETREVMNNLFSNIGYSSSCSPTPIAKQILNSKDYGIPQNRERLWMFCQYGGLPTSFSMVPPKETHTRHIAEFLDPEELVPKNLYLSEEQIDHMKKKHNIDSFMVEEPLCYDAYNKKIRTDGISPTLTEPNHCNLRILIPNREKEVVRKMTIPEMFRLMGLESLSIEGRNTDIVFPNHSYSQLGKRAGNGWDVNVVSRLLLHIFEQL